MITPTPNGAILLAHRRADHGTDIGAAVGVLVTHLQLYSPDDYEEPMLSIAEAQTVLELVTLCGFADAEHSLREYITDRSEAETKTAQAAAEQLERAAFLDTLPKGTVTDEEVRVAPFATASTMVCSFGGAPRKPVAHEHRWSSFGNCLWPWCSAKEPS